MPMYRFYKDNVLVMEHFHLNDEYALFYKDHQLYDRIERVVTDRIVIYERPKPYFLIMGINKLGRHCQYSDTCFKNRADAEQRLAEARERRKNITKKDPDYTFIGNPLMIVEVTPDS